MTERSELMAAYRSPAGESWRRLPMGCGGAAPEQR